MVIKAREKLYKNYVNCFMIFTGNNFFDDT